MSDATLFYYLVVLPILLAGFVGSLWAIRNLGSILYDVRLQGDEVVIVLFRRLVVERIHILEITSIERTTRWSLVTDRTRRPCTFVMSRGGPSSSCAPRLARPV
jgi:hypothetical protein